MAHIKMQANYSCVMSQLKGPHYLNMGQEKTKQNKTKQSLLPFNICNSPRAAKLQVARSQRSLNRLQSLK
jgi:hypothetical protein